MHGKKMYADLTMYNQILKDVLTKKWLGPATKRQLTEEMILIQGVPVSWTSRLVLLPHSKFYYSSKRDDSDIVDALQ